MAPVSTEVVTMTPQFYEEIWFIALMVVMGVLFLLILLACCIRNCGKSNPYIRERLPLQARHGKQPLSFIIDANDGSIVASVTVDQFYFHYIIENSNCSQ